jgi:hypothetical protein
MPETTTANPSATSISTQAVEQGARWVHRDGRPYTTEEKIFFLRSTRRDCLNQFRRSIHTSQGSGLSRYIDRIDAELAELGAEP